MKVSNKHCDLNSCSFCRNCGKEWLPAIQSNRQNLIFKKGEEIFSEGENVKGIYFVNEGTVKVHKKWGDKDLIIRFAKNGDIVGHRGLGSELKFPVSATTLETSNICFISMDFFMASLKVNPDFLLYLMMFFADELKLSENKMRDLAHMPVKGRLAKALIALKTKFGVMNENINLNLSRQDLAAFIGASYETVFRALTEMVDENLITLSNKSIAIIDEKKLSELSASPE